METRDSHHKLTYDDFVRFPEDRFRHEIIDGEHYVTPSPATRHQRISRRLLRLLDTFVEDHRLGEVFDAPFDVLLSRHDIVEPDLMFLSNERASYLTEKNLQGPPDLVIEILSPTTRARDERLKRALYERTGVKEYWLVDPESNAVTIYRRSARGFESPERRSAAAGDLVTTPLLPGFELSLDALFA